MKKRLILLLIAALGISWPLTAKAGDWDEARGIVIQAGGRKKPLDTFANETVLQLSGRREVRNTGSNRPMEALEATLSIWFAERDWREIALINVARPAVRQALGLPVDQRHFTLRQVLENKEVLAAAERLQRKTARGEELDPMEKDIGGVLDRAGILQALVGGRAFTVVPAERVWRPVRPGDGTELSAAWERMGVAFRAGDRAAFSAAAVEFRTVQERIAGTDWPPRGDVPLEIHYNSFHPFRWAWITFVAAFLVLLFRPGYRWGLALFGLATLFTAYGFVLRGLIAHRAPVTNMYETVVWMALALAVIALIFEAIHRARWYVLAAAPVAVLSLILADLLPTVLNPAINPLPPVLRDNFWLTTHVVTIMIGYAGLALAFGLGHIVLWQHLVGSQKAHEKSPLHHFISRSMQVGLLLLVAGTILGGIWAHFSWGRFWGWDPKETWSLIAILTYVFAVHGRLAGWWSNFGVAVSAVLGFHTIIMTWYGVNFVLGAGLHSYGFGGGGAPWVAGAVGLNIAFVVTAVIAHLRRGALEAPASAERETADSVR